MCGINGHAAREGRLISRALVERMNAVLQHRGPDAGGVAQIDFAALGMRRLAIVDVPGGAQPMSADGGRFTLVFNGEIYDFAGLRADLEARGRRFATRSDTEVLLHAWAERGEGCLERLNGMFAFAVADARERTLHLVRDPLGIKPLYWWLSRDGELVFSSEIASLLAHPRVPRELDRDSLAMLFCDRYVADPWTLLQGVHQLPPGHLLAWRDGRIQVSRYFEVLLQPRPIDEREALEELKDLLAKSVRSQLVADVPVGVLLSGGIDSSTVAAFAVREAGGAIDTFSVGFTRPDYDESALARGVARHLGTRHHEVRVEDARFEVSTFDRIVEHVGQPLGDASCIPTWIVSRLAREHVKVVLSGDGGDELFGGYDHMFWAALVRRVGEQTPAGLRRLGHALLERAGSWAEAVFDRDDALLARVRRARKGLELTFHEPLEQFRRMRALWSPEELRALMPDGAELRPEIASFDPSLLRLEPEELAMAVLLRTYLPGAILTKVDRMSMAEGLEVRVPLLDDRVRSFALRLPLGLKVRGRRGKHLLREAGRELLPAAVYAHRKQGFAIPLHAWLNAEFWDLLEALYAPGTRAASLFAREAVAEVIAEAKTAGHRRSQRSEGNAAMRVWLLAMLGRWMERFEVAA